MFTNIILLCAAVLAVACVCVAKRGHLAWLHRKFIALPWFHKVVVMLFLCVWIVHAQKGGDGDDGGDGESGNYSLLASSVQTYAPWTWRGAADDWFILDFPDGWLFPHGSNRWTRCVVLTSGEIWSTTRGINCIAAVGRQMSAVPDESVFTYGLTESNSYLMVWDNFFLNRDTNQPITASIELFRNGDWITRSNKVETVHHRVNPDDWDDDGIPNWDDAEPLVWNGDNFGPHQTLPDGANSNAYSWVDLVAQADAFIEFSGDGASDLVDPSFIAKAGEVNRVTLLIGKTYRAISTMPITVAGRSSTAIEVERMSATELQISWPVTIDAATLARGGNSFNMSVTPANMGGGFVWTNCCCSVSGSGYSFAYGCSGRCHCTGCSASGYFQYEGYRLPATGGSCGCSSDGGDGYGHGDDESGESNAVGISVAFTKPVIFFEAEYTNTVNDIVPWRSTDTRLVCLAYGGATGGVVRVEIDGADDLVQYGGQPLPLMRNLAAGERLCFTNVYRAVSPSVAENAIQATGTFMEYGTDWCETSTDRATAIKLGFIPKFKAPRNQCDYRHKVGVREIIVCSQDPHAPQIIWESSPGGNMLSDKQYQCPLVAAVNPLTAQYGGVEYTPSITVVEPSGIAVSNVQVVAYDVPVNKAGGIGMSIDCYVLPLDVSFAEIAVEEPPNTYYEASGYFADQVFAECWGHSTNMGAGVWCDVRGDNFCGTDIAAIEECLHRVVPGVGFTDDPHFWWTEGRLVWATPSGWGEKSNVATTPQLCKQFDEDQRQIFLISTNGTVEVQKFGLSVRREINGNIERENITTEALLE